MYTSKKDSLYGVHPASTQAMREYFCIDAQQCWAMGYLLGLDCAEVDREESNVCVVDSLVMPLVSILFPNNSVTLPAKLVAL